MAKILVTLLLISWVFNKIPWTEVLAIIKVAKINYLLFSVVTFVLSQWISAKRLIGFFRALQFNIPERENNILYLKGMFYNFFIPGGIGGDAYKVYYLNKTKLWNPKQLTKAIFNDRLSGLVAIIIWVQVCLFFFNDLRYLWPVLIIGISATVFISYQLLGKLFAGFKPIFFESLGLSMLVQGFQLLCVYFLICSFASLKGLQYYLVVFLVSSVLSVLSFSGVGVREWLFYQAATNYDFDQAVAVSIGLLFSLITALVSLTGFFFRLEKK